jgi:hypothetical protein
MRYAASPGSATLATESNRSIVCFALFGAFKPWYEKRQQSNEPMEHDENDAVSADSPALGSTPPAPLN